MLSIMLLGDMFASFPTTESDPQKIHKRLIQCEDAQDAFAFVRKNANKFGIDRNRIAASGGSAGGHLAASIGT